SSGSEESLIEYIKIIPRRNKIQYLQTGIIKHLFLVTKNKLSQYLSFIINNLLIGSFAFFVDHDQSRAPFIIQKEITDVSFRMAKFDMGFFAVQFYHCRWEIRIRILEF